MTFTMGSVGQKAVVAVVEVTRLPAEEGDCFEFGTEVGEEQNRPRASETGLVMRSNWQG